MQHATPFLLVIEPSLTLRAVLAVTLRRHAYPSWQIFSNPVLALQAIRAGHIPVPDIALVCKELPYLDGYQVIHHLRQQGYLTRVILALLEEDGAVERVKARMAGAHAILVKPYTVQQLWYTLQSLSSTR